MHERGVNSQNGRGEGRPPAAGRGLFERDYHAHVISARRLPVEQQHRGPPAVAAAARRAGLGRDGRGSKSRPDRERTAHSGRGLALSPPASHFKLHIGTQWELLLVAVVFVQVAHGGAQLIKWLKLSASSAQAEDHGARSKGKSKI